MLTKRWTVGIWILIGCLLLAAGIGVYKMSQKRSSLVAIDVPDDGCNTGGREVFRTETIDTLLIGKWQHMVDTGWFRVYTLEPAGEGQYWGREWDTSEDIYEEDLKPSGNGWFKWRKEDKAIMEWQMTDINGVIIPYEYKLLKLDVEQLQFKENLSSEKHLFRKI